MKHNKQNGLAALLALCLMLVSAPVFALDLATAKQQGLVGETASGYLEAVQQATPEVKKLIDTINRKRREKYQEIARRNGTSLNAVEVLAGKKAMEKSRPGHYIKPAGRWLKK